MDINAEGLGLQNKTISRYQKQLFPLWKIDWFSTETSDGSWSNVQSLHKDTFHSAITVPLIHEFFSCWHYVLYMLQKLDSTSIIHTFYAHISIYNVQLIMHVPTDLCCSGWFWQWWCCAGESWSSCCPPRRLPPPLPASSLSLWHARSCGSACGSSRARAGPGHPPPATPSHWTLTRTPPQSAHSPPPRSPVEVGRHAGITVRARQCPQEKETHREACTPEQREKWKVEMYRSTAAECKTKENGRIYYRSKSHLCVPQDWMLQSCSTD